MPNRPFRFIHASDFRLDAVPHGLTEVPDHLRDMLLDAPYKAARAVFDAALNNRAAFVIIAGNILQPDLSGPRGVSFLIEQFQRLADAGIGVYWAGGETDPPDAWPIAFPLSENVHVFAKDHVTDFLHQADGSPLARIVGTSRGERALHAAEFSPDAVALFSIGVVCMPVGDGADGTGTVPATLGASLKPQASSLNAADGGSVMPSPPAPLPSGRVRPAGEGSVPLARTAQETVPATLGHHAERDEYVGADGTGTVPATFRASLKPQDSSLNVADGGSVMPSPPAPLPSGRVRPAGEGSVPLARTPQETVPAALGHHAERDEYVGADGTGTATAAFHSSLKPQASSLNAAEIAGLQAQGIHYWALGGLTQRTTLFKSPGVAHYPGTPQGRSPAESGSHGCTLVDVDNQGRAQMTSIAANAVEWLHETLLVDPAMRREGLESLFSQRIHSLAQGPKIDRLISWTIGGRGPLVAELRRGKLRGDLLEWLRIEHGLSSPAVWTVGIELEPQNALPAALYEQETILGDFLRTVREFEADPGQSLEVESLLSEGQTAGKYSQAVRIADAATRKRVLHEAALLAAELLGGEGT